MPRFAANLSMMFNEHAFLDRFAAAAAAGFPAVEFLFPYDFPAETVAERAAAAGIEIALFNLPPGDWAKGERGLAALEGRSEEFRAGVATALRYAEALGVPRLHMMAGNADRRDAAAATRYRDALAHAADAAGAAGRDLVIEPINPRDMPGYFLNDFDYAAELIGELGRPNLKLQFDVYHRQVMRGDVLKGLEAMMPIIGHVQIASVPKRNEPGTGELDDFRIFGTLDALGYAGHVGCEYRPAGETVAGLGWLARAGRRD
ncbi:2-oxo-tetronate isomerase [Prosthecomicrobium pneumaticum]|uniref:Hydroxypyruvate isomerase n=1 Tax=Prosthecomicrobium pneumaticum TaxID=81895 RepID=A0A7W9L2E7_9HYPH|nr:2-oxo-tetronate isomerase [Prosthecomicrobium pneumaticum]MBB5753457.1 hydroxypyruvate isomerase [Prosthecomicrobium pneumaticum]